jgi:hypothetical protein
MAFTTHHEHRHSTLNIDSSREEIMTPFTQKRLLNPMERISEILFGLIMALTFTCTISIATAERGEIRDTLYAAIGCNIAWGLVDAVMYLVTILTERGRNKTILEYVRNTPDVQVARKCIADALPPLIASVISEERLEELRQSLLQLPDSKAKVKLTLEDFKIALGIFLLVFISTFPVAIPFLLVDEPQRALRLSNLVAVLFMFACGWLLGRYGGYNRFLMGFVVMLLGVFLVALTIALGG